MLRSFENREIERNMPYFALVFVILAGLTLGFGYSDAGLISTGLGQSLVFIVLIFAIVSLVAEVVRQQK